MTFTRHDVRLCLAQTTVPRADHRFIAIITCESDSSLISLTLYAAERNAAFARLSLPRLDLCLHSGQVIRPCGDRRTQCKDERVKLAIESTDVAPHDAMPIRVGSAAEFTRVREFLRAVGFHEHLVLATLKVADLSGLPKADSNNIHRAAISPALLSVIDLLVMGETIPADRLIAICGEMVVRDFAALGLIRDAPLHAGSVVCPVWVYPVDGFYIVSDRRTGLDEDTLHHKSELVFPAHDSGALQMLRLLPAIN